MITPYRRKSCVTDPFTRTCVKNAMTGSKRKQKSVFPLGTSDFTVLLKWKMTFKQVGNSQIIGLISGALLGLFLKWMQAITEIKVYTLLLNVDFIPIFASKIGRAHV